MKKNKINLLREVGYIIHKNNSQVLFLLLEKDEEKQSQFPIVMGNWDGNPKK